MFATRTNRTARAGEYISHLSRRSRTIHASPRTARAVPQEIASGDLSRQPPFFNTHATNITSKSSPSGKTPGGLLSPFGSRPIDTQAASSTTTGKLSWNGKDLLLHSGKEPTVVSQWWLRDHCPCSSCTNEITKQRQINLLRGQSKPRIQSVDLQSASYLNVTWTDGHTSSYDRAFLLQHGSPALQALRRGLAPLNLWGASIADSPPSVQHASVSPTNMVPLMSALRQNGLVFIPDTPVSPEASEELLSLIGPIRNTHWGAFTVVTSDLTSKDTAWTAEALDPHNDNTYFSDASGLQMLHLLSHDGPGGESLFVDGFACAAQLHAQDPAAYQLLATVGVHAHSSGDDGVNVQPSDATPVLRHDSSGSLVQVRWNNADRAGLDCPLDQMDAWYAAATQYQALLDRAENRFWVQLRPGSPVIFDNWRVLHGRSEFSGKRTVCGGYINYDDYVSRYRGACYNPEAVRRSTVTG